MLSTLAGKVTTMGALHHHYTVELCTTRDKNGTHSTAPDYPGKKKGDITAKTEPLKMKRESVCQKDKICGEGIIISASPLQPTSAASHEPYLKDSCHNHMHDSPPLFKSPPLPQTLWALVCCLLLAVVTPNAPQRSNMLVLTMRDTTPPDFALCCCSKGFLTALLR